jgi:sensor histidine kinase regulating citrate/malate metabolism
LRCILQKPIESIFELEVTTHTEDNRGSGLTIAKMLIESKLGGKIKVSNKNLGAKFEIYIKS